jgi:hypothetical protein
VAEVQIAAMVKINLRLQATVGALTGQVGAVQAAAAAANQAAANAQAVATTAGNTDRFRPAAPPKYGNKKKDADVKQWISIIEDYLRTAPDADYIRLTSSYLEGGPRSLWASVYEAWIYMLPRTPASEHHDHISTPHPFPPSSWLSQNARPPPLLFACGLFPSLGSFALVLSAYVT